VSAPEFDLTGKVILVTGAAGLIGREVSDAYAAYGATLVLTDLVPEDVLSAHAEGLRRRHPEVKLRTVRADLRSDEEVSDLLAGIRGAFGHLDVLVNLAAIDAKLGDRPAGDEPSRFENYPLEALALSLDVNCTALIRVTQAAVRLMLEGGAGNIINVASTYSLVAPNQELYRVEGRERQVFKPVDYVATKSMIPNLTRYLATYYARDGIRCNAIAPHGVDNNHSDEFRASFARFSPMGRMSSVRELRGPFVFLASDASSYMTGSQLVVDGGWTAW
jgi:NAD(P)-dependent dehydrogenase (short-subunit alcohol dehydrogenase family)